MTNANDPSPANNEASREAGAEASATQSLTDLIDQLDRAAFKRALANRDSFEETVRNRSTRHR